MKKIAIGGDGLGDQQAADNLAKFFGVEYLGRYEGEELDALVYFDQGFFSRKNNIVEGNEKFVSPSTKIIHIIEGIEPGYDGYHDDNYILVVYELREGSNWEVTIKERLNEIAELKEHLGGTKKS